MIVPGELRIGNWFRFPFIGYAKLRNGIDIDAFEEAAGDPIPLTDEWLERCGVGFFEADTATESLINLIYKGAVIATFKRDSLPPCKFVHQLKNLIQSLTGTELEIKPL